MIASRNGNSTGRSEDMDGADCERVVSLPQGEVLTFAYALVCFTAE